MSWFVFYTHDITVIQPKSGSEENSCDFAYADMHFDIIVLGPQLQNCAKDQTNWIA